MYKDQFIKIFLALVLLVILVISIGYFISRNKNINYYIESPKSEMAVEPAEVGELSSILDKNFIISGDQLTVIINGSEDVNYAEIHFKSETYRFLNNNDGNFVYSEGIWYKNTSNYQIEFSHFSMIQNIFKVINERPDLISKSKAKCVNYADTCLQFISLGRFDLVIDESNNHIDSLNYLGEAFRIIYDANLDIEPFEKYIDINSEENARKFFNKLCNDIATINSYYMCERSQIVVK